MPTTDNVKIAEALSRRDSGTIESLYRTHQNGLIRFLTALTRNRDLAEDLTQETWLRVVERGSLHPGDRNFETCLFTVARQAAIDTWRRWDNRVSRSNRDEGSPRRDSLACDRPWPQQLAGTAEMSRRSGIAAGHLPVRLRAVVRLRVEDDPGLEQATERARIAASPCCASGWPPDCFFSAPETASARESADRAGARSTNGPMWAKATSPGGHPARRKRSRHSRDFSFSPSIA
jgi:RNA polymerase sigma-70 factor (ECF subfamily)